MLIAEDTTRVERKGKVRQRPGGGGGRYEMKRGRVHREKKGSGRRKGRWQPREKRKHTDLKKEVPDGIKKSGTEPEKAHDRVYHIKKGVPRWK